MKLITYTMQYLTSILSLGTTEEERNLRDKVDALEEKILILEGNVNELAYCIQQLAATITAVVSNTAQSSNSTMDDYLDSLGKDDDEGSGYLH